MEITWDDLIINFDEGASHRLIEDWKWLIGDDKQPILVSSIGDLFLQDGKGKVYWLDVGGGKLTLVAEHIEEFQQSCRTRIRSTNGS